jgi:hypothetical protein
MKLKEEPHWICVIIPCTQTQKLQYRKDEKVALKMSLRNWDGEKTGLIDILETQFLERETRAKETWDESKATTETPESLNLDLIDEM